MIMAKLGTDVYVIEHTKALMDGLMAFLDDALRNNQKDEALHWYKEILAHQAMFREVGTGTTDPDLKRIRITYPKVIADQALEKLRAHGIKL